MARLVDDLRRYKDSPSMSAEEMSSYLRLRLQLDPEAFAPEETSSLEEQPTKPEGGKGKRGRKKQVVEEQPQSEKTEETAES